MNMTPLRRNGRPSRLPMNARHILRLAFASFVIIFLVTVFSSSPFLSRSLTRESLATWLHLNLPHASFSEPDGYSPPPQKRFRGGPAFTCTEYERNFQAEKFMAAQKNYRTGFALGCAEPVRFGSHLSIVWNTSERTVTLINIGANKGYNIAEWLELWAPQCGVTPQKWGLEYLYPRHPTLFQILSLCGVCSDCRKLPFHSLHSTARAGLLRPAGSFQNADSGGLQIFALEPSQANFGILKELQGFAKHPQLQVLQLAASNVSGMGFFPITRLGSELGSLDVHEAKATSEVRIVTVDEFLLERNLSRVDLLKIDTEGFDPLVLEGGEMTLRANRVRVLEFEYHGIGPWKEVQLDDVIHQLDEFGYDCFLKVPDATYVRLTRCFHRAYEFHNWSNVVCSSRKDAHLISFLMSHCLWLES